MAHATLQFDLCDPHDEREHRYALAGREALVALEEIDQRCRAVLKHGEPSQETREVLEIIRAMIPAELAELLH